VGGSIDYQEINRLAEAGNDGFKCRQFLGLVVVQLGALGPRDVAMERCFEFDSLMLCPYTPIFDVMREAPLIAVEIDSADPLTLF
jgi:hypothetical protein